jgi:homogentisate 1,2-dioxygenase
MGNQALCIIYGASFTCKKDLEGFIKVYRADATAYLQPFRQQDLPTWKHNIQSKRQILNNNFVIT